MTAPTLASGVSLAQIQKVLGLQPVERPRAGDVAVVVGNLDGDRAEGFFGVKEVGYVDQAAAQLEARDPSHVSMDGYSVKGVTGEYYTNNVIPHLSRVVCFRPTREKPALGIIIHELLNMGLPLIEQEEKPAPVQDVTGSGYRAAGHVPYAFP